MASTDIQDVKRRLKSITSMEHITNAMKLVSAAKLRKAKATFDKTHQYFSFITHAIEEVFNNAEDVPRKYLQGSRDGVRKCAYVIITGSRGLCGAFNQNVIRAAVRDMCYCVDEEPILVTIGAKGRDYFAKRGYNIMAEYNEPVEDIPFLETREMSLPLIEMYDREEIDEIKLIYTAFITQMDFQVITKRLLPFEIEPDPDVLKHENYVEYEPSVEEVFNYLVPKYAEMQIYGAIVESATCEHAARRMAMDNATDNAKSMLEDLSLYYNRARQATITNEIIEIVSGAEALK